MNWTPEMTDTAADAWALVATYLDNRRDDRAVLLRCVDDPRHWRWVACHLAEQMAHQARRQYDGAAERIVRRVQHNLALTAGGGTGGDK